MRKAIIVGAGISGLATAEALRRRAQAAGTPVEVELVESASVPGGKIRSSVEQGFVIETGPHGFLDKEPKMFALIDRLGLRDELIPADLSSARRFVVRRDKMRELPSSPPSFLWSDILPFSGKLRAMMEPFAGPRKDDDESVWDFAARRIGPQAADVLVDAMVTGIYGGDPKALSLKAAFPRMFELESKYGSLIKAQMAVAKERRRQRQLEAGPGESALKTSGSAAPARSSGVGAPAGTLHSFKRGLGTLTDALAAHETIHLNQSVQALSREGDRFSVRTPDGSHAADVVVLTTPTYGMVDLLGRWDEAAVQPLTEIPYAAVHVVVHAFDASAVPSGRLHGFGFLIPGGERRNILGSIWASSVFPVHVPDGSIMFRTMLGGIRRTDLAGASDEVLTAHAREELTRYCGLDPSAQPRFERVIRWENAIPQYTQGHDARVAAADTLQSRHPGLFLSGNGLRGVAMLNCVAEGDRVAEAVLQHLS